MNYEDKWFHAAYASREESQCHMAHEVELYFYQAIANGDIDYIDAVSSKEHFQHMEGIGMLSKDPMKNCQFHCVISISLAARTCIDAGMSLEEAFGLSDFYIQQLDYLKTTTDIDSLTYHMNLDFTKRMQRLKKTNHYSKMVQKCMNYIYRNLHGRISVLELSEHVKLNRSHLSRVFKAETGMTLQEYIMNEKIQEAKGMLKYSDYTCNEIAHNLGFASHSHFTKVFKTHTGMTPKEYGKKYYGKAYYR